MPFEEKVTWVGLVVMGVVPVAYFAIMLGRLGDVSAADISYQWPLLIAIGVSIVLTIVGSIMAGIGSGISAELHGRSAAGDLGTDERDKQISRRGDRIGFSVSSVGMVGVLALDDARVRVLLDRQRALPVVRGRDAGRVGGQASPTAGASRWASRPGSATASARSASPPAR